MEAGPVKLKGMLPLLLGSELKTDILMLIFKSGPVFSLEIAESFGRQLSSVQYQMRQLRAMGVLLGFFAHGRYYYDLNPMYDLSDELRAMLEKHFRKLPVAKQRGYFLTPDGERRQNLLQEMTGKGYLGPNGVPQEEQREQEEQAEAEVEAIEMPEAGAPPGAWGRYYRAKVEEDIAAAKRRVAAMAERRR